MRRGTHTGEDDTLDVSKFDAEFAAMFEVSGGSGNADSRDHMGDGDGTAGTCSSMNGSDSTCSMYVCRFVCLHVCMYACMHGYMYV